MRAEPMRVVRAAPALVAEVDRLLPRARVQAPRQEEHLKWWGDSVPFHMVEGVDSFRPRPKLASYAIARKEANDVRSVLRQLVIKRVRTRAEVKEPKR